ncbi:retrovirus-related pol polyprotein from transposon TNT 1-94 [Tanacetum coccineum]
MERKVTTIQLSKDLTSLSLDELIENLKVHEMIIKKDSEIVKAKGEIKSLALKAKKESTDKKFVRQPRNDKKTFQRSRDDKNGKSDRNFFRCGYQNHLIGECPKPPKDKNQRAFMGGSWSDSGEEDDEKAKDETCLIAQASSELFSSYKAYNGGNVIFGSNLHDNIIGKGKICDNKCRVTFSEHDSEITKDSKVIGRGIRNKGLYVMKLGNKPKDKICLVTIDENSTLWHRRLGHANMHLIQSLASKELVRNLPKLKFGQHFCYACKIGKQAHASHKAKNIVSMTICLELLHMDLFVPSAIRSYEGNLYTLVIVDDYSSAFLNGFINKEVYVAQPLGFIDFEKLDHVYKLKKALYGHKQAPKAWYDRLKAFLIKHEYKIGMVGNTLFTKKKSSNLIIVQIYVDDIICGSTCQDMCDEFAKIMHDEFEMSMMGELNFFLGLQIKQMEDAWESVDSTKHRGMIGSLLYLTASRPDIMFSVCLCARFQEIPKTSHLEAVNRIFRYIKGTMHLGLWYPKGIDIETVKQTVLAISTTEAEYISARKACQQALWMKQALIDYDIRLDDVPIMSEKFNLAFFIAKRMEFVTTQARLILPYGMLLTRLFMFVMGESPELFKESYVLYDHVMYPLAAQQEQKTRKYYGMKRGRHSTSSSSAFGQPSSSHLNDDDDDGNDEGTSHASTPSLTRFVNSLTDEEVLDDSCGIRFVRKRIFMDSMILHSLHPHHLHNHLLYFSFTSMDFTQASSSNPSKKIKLTIIPPRQLFVNISSDEDDTTTPSLITKSSFPSLPNAPSKTLSTKDTPSTFGTTSSLFELKPQSSPPSLNDTPSPQSSNPFLNDIMDAPSRPSNLIPLQSHPSLDITLSLTPITLLDHILYTLSPPSSQPPPEPPLMGHPI